MSNKLTLKKGANGTNGCKPDDKIWKPKKNGEVRIVNKSGSEQILSCITEGLLSPMDDDKSITVSTKKDWKGTVGPDKGTYTYNYGGDDLSTRKGTIDPS
jgi:hypothetical protein